MKEAIESTLQLQELEAAPRSSLSQMEVDILRRRIPSRILNLYDRFRARDRKAVVVLSSTGVCQGCYTRVSRGLQVALQRGEGWHQCEHCQRLLHLRPVSTRENGGHQPAAQPGAAVVRG